MKSKKLGLLTEKIGSGVTPRGGIRVYTNNGTYLIRSQNIYNNYFERKGLVCITDETAEKMKNVEVKENDDRLSCPYGTRLACLVEKRGNRRKFYL